MTQKIVIIGGGFGGVKAALDLGQDERFNVTLISDQDYFRYYPAMYHAAGGGAGRMWAIPLNEVFAEHPNITLIKARATHLDRAKKQVITKGAGAIDYDKLIVAVGMVTNYFGIKGLDRYSYGIKSVEEVEELKAHLHKQLTTDHRPDHHYIVVGGGPTGIEVSSMLPGYLKRVMEYHGINYKGKVHVDLIEAAPRIAPRLPKDVARAHAKRLRKLGVTIHTNQKVEAATTDSLIINGQPLASKTIVWTAGLASNPFLQDNNFTMTEHRKVAVDQYLQAEDSVYVIGDNADTIYSGVADTAVRDGQFVAANLKRLASGKQPKPYQPKRPIYVTPTGPSWSSVIWGKWHFYGRLGYAMRRLTDWVAYRRLQPWWPASRRWLAVGEREESCPICASSLG